MPQGYTVFAVSNIDTDDFRMKIAAHYQSVEGGGTKSEIFRIAVLCDDLTNENKDVGGVGTYSCVGAAVIGGR